jgi:hypothetical protein
MSADETEKARLPRELRGITATLAAFGAAYKKGKRLGDDSPQHVKNVSPRRSIVLLQNNC